MRIKIMFSPNTIDMPIQNQSLVNSYIHTKCLGHNNEYHDKPSNYSISGLQGGKINTDKKTLSFPNGCFIVVSSKDMIFLDKIIDGVMSNPDFTHGMIHSDIQHISERFVNGWNNFVTISPILIKNKEKKGFITLKDPDFKNKVKIYLINKISKIDSSLDLSDFDIEIPNRPSNKVRNILVKNVRNDASQCHIFIHTNKKVADLLYNIGIGQSTGSGFGTIYKVENHHLYGRGKKDDDKINKLELEIIDLK